MNCIPNGKIARLPMALRQKVNLMLQDNVPGTKIAAWLSREHAAELKAAGIEEITCLNISWWRRKGHQKWVQQQQRLEDMRARQEFAMELARRGDNSLQEATLVMAASQIYEAVEDFDVQILKTKLKEKPELYGLLIEAISKIGRAGLGERKLQLELTKYQDRVAEQKRKIEEQLGKAKQGGLTPEVIAQMEEALNLL